MKPPRLRLSHLALSAAGVRSGLSALGDNRRAKVNETLVPKLSQLQGFKGYYLIEADNGVISSLGLFETLEQADESTKVAASWIRDERLENAFPNPPKITSGKVMTHKNGVTA